MNDGLSLSQWRIWYAITITVVYAINILKLNIFLIISNISTAN